MKDLNKQYRLIQKHGSETMSSCSEYQTSCFNMYRNITDNNKRVKMPYYMVVTLARNEHRVFCIPIKIEKKYF